MLVQTLEIIASFSQIFLGRFFLMNLILGRLRYLM